MAALGDERLFALLERDGEAIARGDEAAFASGAVAELVERAALGEGRGRRSPTSASRARPAGGSRSTSATRSGHAFEAAGGYGDAAPRRGRRVRAAGGVRIGVALGVTPPERADRIERAARRARARRSSRCPTRSTTVLDHLGTDKKHAGGRLRWVLPTADGVGRPRRRPGRARRATAAGVACCTPRAAPAMTDASSSSRARTSTSLGTREPEIYGHETLDEIHAGIAARAAELGLEVAFFQSNHEGALIDRLHERDFDVAIVNAGGLTHTSVALRDALLGVQRPFIEVHLSDPATREPFRQVNFLHDIALESIVGQGARGLPPGARVDRPRVRRRRWPDAWRPGRRPRDRRAAPAAPTDRRARPADRRRCSTNGPSWRARPGGPRPPRADARSATPSASARCCSGSRWRTRGRCRRPTCWRSTAA